MRGSYGLEVRGVVATTAGEGGRCVVTMTTVRDVWIVSDKEENMFPKSVDLGNRIVDTSF